MTFRELIRARLTGKPVLNQYCQPDLSGGPTLVFQRIPFTPFFRYTEHPNPFKAQVIIPAGNTQPIAENENVVIVHPPVVPPALPDAPGAIYPFDPLA